MISPQSMSRRTALKGLVAGMAGSAGRRWRHAGQPSSGGVFIEKQSSGAEVWQVTTEQCDQSNIYSHAHPYVTPDLKWVIFNSNRSGAAHVHAARIPDELMAGLLA